MSKFESKIIDTEVIDATISDRFLYYAKQRDNIYTIYKYDIISRKIVSSFSRSVNGVLKIDADKNGFIETRRDRNFLISFNNNESVSRSEADNPIALTYPVGWYREIKARNPNIAKYITDNTLKKKFEVQSVNINNNYFTFQTSNQETFIYSLQNSKLIAKFDHSCICVYIDLDNDRIVTLSDENELSLYYRDRIDIALIGTSQRDSVLSSHLASEWMYDRRLWRRVSDFMSSDV